jgi:uncharacterized protein YndB with AHSA1/START domain
MKERSATHATFVIEPSYPTTPQRVFAAFSDPAKKRRWFTVEEESKVDKFEMDFRVGGGERSSFRVQSVTCTNDTIYLDTVPDRRIVIAYTMTLGAKRISSSQATGEMLPMEQGTELIFTEPAAFFEGADGSRMHEEDWRKPLENLAQEVAC